MSVGGTLGRVLIASVIAAAPALAQQSSGWTAEGPSVRIGSLDGGDPYLFEHARTGLLLSDGSVLVADRHELRVFDSSGSHTRTMGRTGAGPGEFKSILWVTEGASRLLAYDWLQRRVTAFSTDGDVISTDVVSYPDHDGSLSLIWSDGSEGEAYRVTRDNPTMYQEDPDNYVTSASGGALLLRDGDDLTEHLAGTYDRKYIARVGNHVSFGTEPLTSALETAAGSSFVVAMPRDSDTLRVFQPDGERLDIALAIPPRDVSRADRRAFESRFVTGASSDRRAAERGLVMERMEWPSVAPRIDMLTVDSDDRVWVRLFDLGGESTRWLLVDPFTGARRPVSLPADRELLDARGERLLLRSVDELGVPIVEVWSIAPEA